MVSKDPNHNASREAAEEVFQEKMEILLRTVLFALLAIFGLLITASSFNMTSIILMILGIAIGLGTIFVSIRAILRLYGITA